MRPKTLLNYEGPYSTFKTWLHQVQGLVGVSLLIKARMLWYPKKPRINSEGVLLESQREPRHVSMVLGYLGKRSCTRRLESHFGLRRQEKRLKQ